jgi:hypothetical protein
MVVSSRPGLSPEYIQRPPDCNRSYREYLVRGRIWPVYWLALAYQVTSAVWRLAGRLPSRLLQNTAAIEKALVSLGAQSMGDLVHGCSP